MSSSAASFARSCARRGVAAVLTAALAVVSLAVVVPIAAGAQSAEDDAARAAREIQDARDRANAAADAFFEAQSALELLEDDVDRLELEADQLAERVENLRRDVEAIALARFVNSGTLGIPLLTGLQDPKDQVQAEVYVDVMTNTGNSTLDRYDAAESDLAEKRDELGERRREIEAKKDEFTLLQDEAEAEVERLREIEETRLQDEAVRRALEAQQAAERERLVEQARQEAEARARARPNPGIVAQTEIAAAAEAAANPTTTLSDGSVPDGSVPDDAAADGDTDDAAATDTIGATTPAGPVATVETLPTNEGASGGTSGGRTGTGGSGSRPLGGFVGGGVIGVGGGTYIDAMVCPMLGSAYGDTWGAPRSGGRRHQGVDMLAPTGVPIVAVVSGVVTFKQNRLGGNAVSLVGDNGNRYYYAHLSRYEGASRRVQQGEVIGYNGDTGNATGVPHLHFEIRPGGGVTVNPTPSVRAAGC
ncbi:MAG: peptidoglycan DD-metalloendopeptidase family protein [Actinomycetota bacterium]